jgi:hypothetical protein
VPSVLTSAPKMLKTVVTSEDVRNRAERLKHGLCETYGTAGKEFIACLLTLKGENDEALSYQEMCNSSRCIKRLLWHSDR